MFSDKSDTINGYVVYPEPLTAKFKQDKDNYAKALTAIKFFKETMKDDPLVATIDNIGAYDDFYNEAEPDDFFYKIDIDKKDDVQLKTTICISVLTLNSHPHIANYYRRITSDAGEPVFQNYVGPITTPDKRNGERLLYSYTTSSIFKLHAFFYLKNKHQFNNVAILNALGYVSGNANTVISAADRETIRRKSENKNNADSNYAKMQVEFMQMKMGMEQYLEGVSNAFNAFEKRLLNDNRVVIELTDKQSTLKSLDVKAFELERAYRIESKKKNELLLQSDKLVNLHEQLTENIKRNKDRLDNNATKIAEAKARIDQLDNESSQQAKSIEESRQTEPVKRGLFSRLLFKEVEPTPVRIEVKDFSSMNKLMRDQLEALNDERVEIVTEISKSEMLVNSIKEELARLESSLKDTDAVLKSIENELAEIPKAKEEIQNTINALQQPLLESDLAQTLVELKSNIMPKMINHATANIQQYSQLEQYDNDGLSDIKDSILVVNSDWVENK